MGRLIYIGDVHGCLEELKELVEKLQVQKSDKVLLLGDAVDKGPDSKGVLDFIRKEGYNSLLGNHEIKFLKYRKHLALKKKNPDYIVPVKMAEDQIEAYHSLSPSDLHWLSKRKMFSYNSKKNIFAVHAGVLPITGNRTIFEQPSSIYFYIRFVNEDGKMSKNVFNSNRSNSHFPWFEKYNGPHNVVFGHNVFSADKPIVCENALGAKTFSLDNGCVQGDKDGNLGHLTALIVPLTGGRVLEYDFVQVKSKEIYYKKDH